MKNVKWIALFGSLTTVMLLGACSSTPVATPVVKSPATAQPVAVPAPLPKVVATPTPVVKSEIAAYLDPNSALSKEKSVFFDFDQYTVKPEGQRVLEMHAKYLAAHASVKVKIEGNADDQGSAEYNLALGQKRADAAVKVLKIFGAKDAQLESVSFGKEKPIALGHDDQSRSQNRRVDIDYLSK